MTCYRIRMRFGTSGEDFAERVWLAGKVGFWFGSWNINDLQASYEAYRPKENGQVTKFEIAEYINKVLRERGLPANMSAAYVSPIKKFDETLVRGSWVCTYFDGQLHLGQIADDAPHDDPAFNYRDEHFKARFVTNQKSFEVARLPDVFRTLASAGQQTIHRLKDYAVLASILIDAKDENEVLKTVLALPLEEWFDALGYKSWESVCTAYLILEHGFVPTGLTVGSTLPDFDIVGHDLSGVPIYGQCKKKPGVYQFEDKDVRSFDRLPATAKKFFFPYGGPDESELDGVAIISYKRLANWLHTSSTGRRYKAVLRSAADDNRA